MLEPSCRTSGEYDSQDSRLGSVLAAVEMLEIARNKATLRLKTGSPRCDYNQSTKRMRELIMLLESVVNRTRSIGIRVADILRESGPSIVEGETSMVTMDQMLRSREVETSELQADLDHQTRELEELDHRVFEKEHEVTRCMRRLRELSEQRRVNDSVESYEILRTLYSDYVRKFKSLEFVNFKIHELKQKRAVQLQGLAGSDIDSENEIIITGELL